MDSIKNWRIKCERNEPITFLNANPFARLAERAVDQIHEVDARDDQDKPGNG